MKLVVFGANGPTGRLVTRQALGEGHTVTAVARNPDTFPIQDARLRVAAADALDAAQVDRVVAGHDRVISTLGVPYTKEPVTIFSQGARNIAAAMDRHGLRRLVCVTSIGVHPSSHPRRS
ncbi:NAD(P)-dependent oxidoreductase [Actinomadura viridis]|uniref:NAD(P)-dependent oxidoreductase n=1 Tax=Actinomadura viridis TaxID=58110 RepID=UPI0036BDDBA6